MKIRHKYGPGARRRGSFGQWVVDNAPVGAIRDVGGRDLAVMTGMEFDVVEPAIPKPLRRGGAGRSGRRRRG